VWLKLSDIRLGFLTLVYKHTSSSLRERARGARERDGGKEGGMWYVLKEALDEEGPPLRMEERRVEADKDVHSHRSRRA
jgi:hypothetical protein